MSDFLLDIAIFQNDYLCHHGTKGQKWGVRRYQNPDGSLTDAGRLRYRKGDGKLTSEGKAKLRKTKKNLRELENKVALTQYASKKQYKDFNKKIEKAAEKSKSQGYVDLKEASELFKSINRYQYMTKVELPKTIDNYKKYTDYAMKTFGDQKLDTMKYDKEGNPIARKNNAALIAGSAIVADLVAGPAAAVGVGLLINAAENDAAYKELQKKADVYNKKKEEEQAKKKEVATVIKL